METDTDNLPQLQTVVTPQQLQVDQHQWLQSGYTIIDQCCDGQAIAIPSGKTLIKVDGKYELIDELSS